MALEIMPVKFNPVGSAKVDGGAQLKVLRAELDDEPILSINGAAVAVPFPAAIVFTTKEADGAQVGAAGEAGIVIEPAVVAVLLEARKIDLDCEETLEL